MGNCEIIRPSDGTVIRAGEQNNIRSCNVTRMVNDGTELRIGSVCCAALEAVVQMEDTLRAGETVQLWSGQELLGTFVLERPTRTGEVVYRLTGFDYVSRLDRDLSLWLEGLNGWPYGLLEFAGMVCDQCGLELGTQQIPNEDMPVRQFLKKGVTGRQIMSWIAELACRFCYADAEGKICFGWYRDRGVKITPGGDRFYFNGGLRYEDYTVSAIDGVRLRLADAPGGALWPEGEAENPYILSSNPIALAQVDEALEQRLGVIQAELAALPAYRTGSVEILAGTDIVPGDVVTVEDRRGTVFSLPVMSQRIRGHRMILECTGSERRDSTTAANNKYLGNVLQDVLDGLTQAEIFHKLTDGGKIQGIYHRDGKWYINAEIAQIENLRADSIVAGKLTSLDGDTWFDLDAGCMESVNSNGYTLRISGGRLDLVDSKGRICFNVAANKKGCGLSFYTLNGTDAFGLWTDGTDTFLQLPNLDDPGEILTYYKVGWKMVDGVPMMVGYQ